MKETKTNIYGALTELEEDDCCYYLDSKGHMIGRTDLCSMITFAVVMLEKVKSQYGELGMNLIRENFDLEEEE